MGWGPSRTYLGGPYMVRSKLKKFEHVQGAWEGPGPEPEGLYRMGACGVRPRDHYMVAGGGWSQVLLWIPSLWTEWLTNKYHWKHYLPLTYMTGGKYVTLFISGYSSKKLINTLLVLPKRIHSYVKLYSNNNLSDYRRISCEAFILRHRHCVQQPVWLMQSNCDHKERIK